MAHLAIHDPGVETAAAVFARARATFEWRRAGYERHVVFFSATSSRAGADHSAAGPESYAKFTCLTDGGSWLFSR
jgi:hypothetical protein